jgi:transposase-like protein
MGMPQLVVTAVLVEGRSKSEVAREYGVSRRWVITLVQRYLAEGNAGLAPRSRRPLTSPQRTTQELEDEIVAIAVVVSRRLALVIGSQCPALGMLSFLPAGSGPVELAGLADSQRLLVRLWELLVAGVGECAPVLVPGQSGPGLLFNPTKAIADAALTAALSQAHRHQAVLVVHFLGHGSGWQTDPAAPARHLLHVWDTVAEPIDTEPESNGWGPYELVARRQPHAKDVVGLVLLVDACRAAWAKQQVDAWSGVRAGLLSAWLGSSGDHNAWDGCFTRTLVRLLEQGVAASEHPRRLLVPELLPTDLEPLVTRACPRQAPRLGGYESHNPVLVLARNRRASELAAELGLDGLTETLLLRLTNDYVSFAVAPVAQALGEARVVVVKPFSYPTLRPALIRRDRILQRVDPVAQELKPDHRAQTEHSTPV